MNALLGRAQLTKLSRAMLFRARLCAVLIASSSALPGAFAQSKPPAAESSHAVFDGTLDEAFARAAERNVPLVLVAIVEAEGGKADKDILDFRKQLFSDAKLAEAFVFALPIIACNQSHPTAEIEVEQSGRKVKRTVCSIYRTEGCTVHQKQFDALYREYNVEGELKSPSALVVLPDRTVQARWQTGSAEGVVGGILGSIAAGRTKLGEGLSEPQLLEVRELLLRARKRGEAQDWAQSYAAGAGVLAITQKTKQADEARAAQAAAIAALETMRDEGLAWLREGKVREGYQRLLDTNAACAGTPLAKELPKTIKSIEGDKAFKDVIAAYKRELEAEALWREAEALTSSREEKKAEAKIRALCRKFADTPAGARARERYPAIAAEEDAKKSGGG